MFGKPVLSKDLKYIRLDGHVSQAETMASSREPEGQYSGRKQTKWVSYNDQQQQQKEKQQSNMTMYLFRNEDTTSP